MQMALSCLLLAAALPAQPPAPGWTPEFSFQFQNVTAVTISPDGQQAAWIQSKPVMDTEKSETLSHIWVARTDGARRFQLTRGDISSASPVWSPDSKYIYFTSARAGSEQIYRAYIAGGEAEKLTDFKGAIGTFSIAPDGKSLAFKAAETDPALEKAKKEKRDFRVVGANPANHSLYLLPLDGEGKHRKLFDARYHIANFSWSPDSKTIAFERWPSPLAGNWTKADISEADIATGAVKDLAATAAVESTPFYSPDGRYIALNNGSTRWAGERRINLLTRATAQLRPLPATYDEQPHILGWAPDSSKIYFVEPKRTRTYLGAMPLDGPPATVYESARGVFTPDLNTTGTHFGLTAETPSEPVEAYVLPVADATAPKKISRANTGIPLPALGRTETISWKSPDGREIEGLLTYPVSYQPGQKVPLLLNIHGGPAGVFTENFIGRAAIYPLAAFAAKGFAILRPNPRGSSGYGRQFRFDNINDWGGKDYEDDQAGVDKVIAMGIADPAKLAIMGWSYGGYMTSWTITQTKRFKAAVIGAPVTNLWSFTGTADIPGFLPDYFSGEPFQNFEAYRKHSPITHIKNVVTPTLLLHGEADERVPIGQGYEYYNALKRQGGIAKMVAYPRTPHGPREPKFVLDIMRRHLDWMEKYVQ